MASLDGRAFAPPQSFEEKQMLSLFCPLRRHSLLLHSVNYHLTFGFKLHLIEITLLERTNDFLSPHLMSHLCLLLFPLFFIAFCSRGSDCFSYFSSKDSRFLCWFHFLFVSLRQTFFMVLFVALFSCLYMLMISPNSFLHILIPHCQ